MLKRALIPIIALAVAPVVFAQNAQAVLDAAQNAMGIATMRSLHLMASGTLADAGEAYGGNAPRPIVKEYEADIDFATPAMRLRLHRTNPDGTELTHGGEETQFVSGMYAWDQPPVSRRANNPAEGGGPPPRFGVGDPLVRESSKAIARRLQIMLTPPGFLKAAVQNSAAVTAQGANQVVTFTTPQRQRFAGTLDSMNLLTKITTTNPAKNNAPVEVTFTMYRTFAGVRFPSRIVQTEGGAPFLDLTVSDVKPNQAAAITVPPSVPQAVPPTRS